MSIVNNEYSVIQRFEPHVGGVHVYVCVLACPPAYGNKRMQLLSCTDFLPNYSMANCAFAASRYPDQSLGEQRSRSNSRRFDALIAEASQSKCVTGPCPQKVVNCRGNVSVEIVEKSTASQHHIHLILPAILAR